MKLELLEGAFIASENNEVEGTVIKFDQNTGLCDFKTKKDVVLSIEISKIEFLKIEFEKGVELFDFVEDENDEQPLQFMQVKDASEYCKDNGIPNKDFSHIFSYVEGEEDEEEDENGFNYNLFYFNGYHPCNNLAYCVTRNSWTELGLSTNACIELF